MTTVLHLHTCICVLLIFFLKWIKRNTNVNFVIKFSVMEKIETDMKRLVYFFYQGKYLKGRETIVVRGPTGEVAPGRQQP